MITLVLLSHENFHFPVHLLGILPKLSIKRPQFNEISPSTRKVISPDIVLLHESQLKFISIRLLCADA